jgi:hypothetical protein
MPTYETIGINVEHITTCVEEFLYFKQILIFYAHLSVK